MFHIKHVTYYEATDKESCWLAKLLRHYCFITTYTRYYIGFFFFFSFSPVPPPSLFSFSSSFSSIYILIQSQSWYQDVLLFQFSDYPRKSQVWYQYSFSSFRIPAHNDKFDINVDFQFPDTRAQSQVRYQCRLPVPGYPRTITSLISM